MIDLQQLRVFVRSAELKSFTRAALALGITQPAVSHIVKHLEQIWGTRLFYRTGRGVTLSEHGELAYLRAKALIEDADRISAELKLLGELPSGPVSLGLPHSLVQTVLPTLLQQLRRDAPAIKLTIHEAISDYQVDHWLSEGVVDIGIGNRYEEGAMPDRGRIHASPIVLSTPARAGRAPDRITLAELCRLPLVLPAFPGKLRIFIEGIARRRSLSLNIVVDANSVYAQKQFCDTFSLSMISTYASLLSETSRGESAVTLITEPLAFGSLTIGTTRQRPLSLAVRDVVKRLGPLLRLEPPLLR